MADATTYFAVTAAMVKRKYKDTDFSDGDILLEAQEQEYDVMDQLSLTAAPSDTIRKARLAKAIVLMTASQLEGNEPHSRADGSVREDKMSRVLWMKEAQDIVNSCRTRHMASTSYQTDQIKDTWDE